MRMFIGAAGSQRRRYKPTEARATGWGSSAVPQCVVRTDRQCHRIAIGHAFHRICANRYELGIANSRPPSLSISPLNCKQASFWSLRRQKRPARPQRVHARQNHPSRSAHAATRDNVFARHPARVVRRKKHCDRRDVIRLTQPAEWSLAERPRVKVRPDYP
jgi:hypothetical protein